MAKRKILIVDDEILVARELEGQLTRLGYEVAAIASSGKEAISAAAQAGPDLVLMDMALRGSMNSVVAAKELQRHRKIPVVFMITEADEASLQRGDLTNSFFYAVSPFTERELRASIDLALCKHDASRVAHRDGGSLLYQRGRHALLSRLQRILQAAQSRVGANTRLHPRGADVAPVHRVRASRRSRAHAEAERPRQGGGQALAFENRYLCKDGSFRWFHWNAAPDSSEKVIYSVARDITASKQAEEEREQLVRELQAALAEVKTLREILPICSYCRKIRDDENYWHTVENYISRHTATRFSHGICPSCMATQMESQLERE